MQFAAASVYFPVGVADYPARWTTGADEASQQAVQDAAIARMKVGWDVIAAQHAGTPFFLGERPHVCDVYLANLSRWWKMRDYLQERHPAFHALMQRVDALPDVAPVWARHWE
jgi:GST-like protein